MRRILLVLFFLYSVVDFANPSVPGAVTFDGGAMETAKAERQRPTTRPIVEAVPEVVGHPLTPSPVVRPTTRVMPHTWAFNAHRFNAPVDPGPVPSSDDD